MVAAISSGLPTRLSGTVAAKPAFLSAVTGEAIQHGNIDWTGATMLMRTPMAAARAPPTWSVLRLHACSRSIWSRPQRQYRRR